MTTFGTIATIGAAALIVGAGVGIYIMSKKDSEDTLDFEKFREMCISRASKYNLEDVATAIIVIDRFNDKVQPSFYRKYADGKVTKIQLQVSPISYDLLPDEIKTRFNNGQAVLAKVK